MARSGCGNAAIFSSTSLSPFALISWMRSFIAARSSPVNPAGLFLEVVVLPGDFWASFFAGFMPGSFPMNGSTPRPLRIVADSKSCVPTGKRRQANRRLSWRPGLVRLDD